MGEISLKFCDSNSILIINVNGKIGHLYTPFSVRCIEDVGIIKLGSIVQVEEVAQGNRDELIYFIKDGAYFHKHFHIVITLPPQ